MYFKKWLTCIKLQENVILRGEYSKSFSNPVLIKQYTKILGSEVECTSQYFHS